MMKIIMLKKKNMALKLIQAISVASQMIVSWISCEHREEHLRRLLIRDQGFYVEKFVHAIVENRRVISESCMYFN